VGVLFGLHVGYSALNTVSRLNVVEAERDQWQRPSVVIQALALRQGDVVADLGCGSGYFTLKLSAPVAGNGRVIAEDIRRLPLAFLWFRAAASHEHNVSIIVGDPNNPHLPTRVNSVLISNTFHEFTDSHSILVHVYQSLVSAGRIVIIDRTPKLTTDTASETAQHEISAEQVEEELHRAQFSILNRDDHFIERDPYGETWWLIIARKP
jgi:ubiquinone/menaquinone biosynthesis C-methylase UbiE